VLFFGLSTWVLALILSTVIIGATVLGHLVGRSTRGQEHVREPFAVMQAALIGFMGLVLAFGISLAVGRYEARRAAVVDESNAIGTSYLRAQTLTEPVRAESLALLRRYTDISITLTDTVPGTPAEQQAVAESAQVEGRLWTLAGQVLAEAPVASAPRLYVESLNEMIDLQTTQITGRQNRVPWAVLLLEVIGAVVALGLLAAHLAFMGRGGLAVVLAATLIALLLLVTFDLDRPTRGVITVPDKPLVDARAEMALPPAASGSEDP
jgi:hypothetical protein